MRYSPLVNRTVSRGWQAWNVHMRAKQMLDQGEEVILLTIGDPDFDTPEPIIERAVHSLRNGRTHYTPLMGELPVRQAIAQRYAHEWGREVLPDNVILVTGAQCGLFVTALCLFELGDEVIVADPTYTTYPYVFGAAGATAVTVPLRPERNFQIDPDDVDAAVTERTRAILLNTPHNPTGSVIHRENVEALADIAQRRDLWFVTDEVYDAFTYEQPHISPASLPGMAERSIVISSLSKSHAMTGWRMGWVVGPEQMIGYAGNIMAGMVFGAPPFVQDAALTALTDNWGVALEMREHYRRRRDMVLDIIDGAPNLRCHRPEGGIYIMLDVRPTGLSSFDFADRLLEQERVALLPGEGFGDSAAGHLRLSLTETDELLREGCERIVRFAESL